MSSNQQRAWWAERCVNHFAFLTGVDDTADAVGDLICNLGHYCEANRIDFMKCVRTGLGHWYVERTDPESQNLLPVVTISIK